MKAICENDLVIDCTDYKALESGVVLLGEDGEETIAYVPTSKLEYILPDDTVELEHERLGVEPPEITSQEDLETRLSAFADEVEHLQEQLASQVETMIDEGPPADDADFEQQDRLRERRRTIDRLLQQVRQRARQFQQLSAVETTPAGTEAVTAEPTSETEDVTELRSEMDERFARIEQRLAELTPEEPEEEHPIEGISGLGPTYRDRLSDAGIETMEALADQSPEDVASAASVSENRAERWIEQANETLESEEASAA